MPVVRRSDVSLADLPGRRSGDPVPAGLGAEYAVRLVRVPPGARTPHLHPHSDEVTYVVAGTGTAYEAPAASAALPGSSDGATEGFGTGDLTADRFTATRVGPGDTIVVPRGAPHATVADDGAELELLCFFPRPDVATNLVELGSPTLHA